MPHRAQHGQTPGLRRLVLAGMVALQIALPIASAQTPAPSADPSLAANIEETRQAVTRLRDAFVAAATATGLSCRIQPPLVVVQDVPSFGSYEPDTNTLTTSAWLQMTDEKRSVFYKFLGPGTTEPQAREEFEMGTHHWVLVHELGHWWQACRGVTDHRDHYAIEYGADRIAAAYWQERDPSVVVHQRAVFEAILSRWPDPVPPGRDPQHFFNTQYEALGPTPAYIWFQARMCVAAFNEKPFPTFRQVLQETGAPPKAR